MKKTNRKCHFSNVILTKETKVNIFIVYAGKDLKYKICSTLINATYDDFNNVFNPIDFNEIEVANEEFNRLTHSKITIVDFEKVLNNNSITESEYTISAIPVLTSLAESFISYLNNSDYIVTLKEQIFKSMITTIKTVEIKNKLEDINSSNNTENNNVLFLKNYNIVDMEDIPTLHFLDIPNFVSLKKLLNIYIPSIAIEKYINIVSINQAVIFGNTDLTPSFEETKTSNDNISKFNKIISDNFN